MSISMEQSGGQQGAGPESKSGKEGPDALFLHSPSRSLFSVFTLEDVFMLTYLVIISVLVFRWGTGPNQASIARQLYACIAVILTGCFLSRATDLPSLVRAAVYRISIAGVLLYNYLMLRDLLPAVRPDSVDDFLWHLDVRIFGVEPSLWLERLNHRPVVEWFSFFYFSYFFICGTYMVTVVWLSKPGRMTSEFALGTLTVFCVGQLGYMAVPGYGPIRHLASQFHGPINGGFFWSCVWNTVQAGSAMKDIFPSLHTGVPTWFTFFAFTQARRDPRWRWPARITGFFAANIIFSTMFLRWHYAVDVVAGLCLATSAGLLAPRLAAWQEGFRERLGLPGSWFFPPRVEGPKGAERP